MFLFLLTITCIACATLTVIMRRAKWLRFLLLNLALAIALPNALYLLASINATHPQETRAWLPLFTLPASTLGIIIACLLRVLLHIIQKQAHTHRH